MDNTTWSYEKLLNFAPDSGVLEQARKLFFSKRWLVLEGNGQWLWGEYKTAYGDQHKAAVRLESPLFKCSCKSRRRPCKHSLALVLLFLNRPNNWVVKEQPPEWLQSQIESKSTNRAPLINVAKQEKRITLMDQGVAELEKWLINIIQQGVAQYTDKQDWENIASRMVDAKLGTIARRLRYCQSLFQNDNWIDDVIKELGSLYLFVRAWQQKTNLSIPQKKALLQVAGWTIRKEAVLQSTNITDNWLVLGLTTGKEDKLTFRRSWFRGENSRRFALILDFSYGNRGFEDHWLVGAVLSGDLAFYPGTSNFRGLFKKFQSSKLPYDLQAGYENFSALGQEYSQTLTLSPWLLAFPCLLNDINIEYSKELKCFFIWDKERNGIKMLDSVMAWQLLAISGGRPLTVFGEYNGNIFTPLTVIEDGKITELK